MYAEKKEFDGRGRDVREVYLHTAQYLLSD